MSIPSIHSVQLAFPAGPEASRQRFYASLLGLPDVPRRGGKALRLAAGPQRTDLVCTERGHAVSALRHRLWRADVPLAENRALPGYLRFYVEDPAGNPLVFLGPDPEPLHEPPRGPHEARSADPTSRADSTRESFIPVLREALP